MTRNFVELEDDLKVAILLQHDVCSGNVKYIARDVTSINVEGVFEGVWLHLKNVCDFLYSTSS